MANIEHWWLLKHRDDPDRTPIIRMVEPTAITGATIYDVVEVVPAADLEGAVEECERLREALAWYANGDHFPHPDYAARARSALRGPRGAGKP